MRIRDLRGLITVMLVVFSCALFLPITTKAAEGMDLYCLYNAATNEYLFTIDQNEVNVLQQTWENKGCICTLPNVSNCPVYRLCDPRTTKHLYTSDDNEIKLLVNAGWTNEGVAFYVSDGQEAPVYRLYEKATGAHRFSADLNEIAILENAGWVKEGIAFYALSGHVNGSISSFGDTLLSDESKTVFDVDCGNRGIIQVIAPKVLTLGANNDKEYYTGQITFLGAQCMGDCIDISYFVNDEDWWSWFDLTFLDTNGTTLWVSEHPVKWNQEGTVEHCRINKSALNYNLGFIVIDQYDNRVEHESYWILN